MWPAEHGRSQLEIRGRAEMHKLAMAAAAAMENSNLYDVIEQVQRRVFAQGTDTILEAYWADSVWHFRFKPMVELVLRHIIHSATDASRSLDERRREILFALEFAGF